MDEQVYLYVYLLLSRDRPSYLLLFILFGGFGYITWVRTGIKTSIKQPDASPNLMRHPVFVI